MSHDNSFKRINMLIQAIRIAKKINNPALLHMAQTNIKLYKSRGKNKTASHPKPHAHMALVRAAQTKHNKGKNK